MSLCSVRRRFHVIVLALAGVSFLIAPHVAAQGGEPQTFAIRGAKIVPVASAPVSNGTVVFSHGIITAVGTNVTVPPDAWIIDGNGLTVYPGLIDAFTDVGLAIAPAPAAAPAPAPVPVPSGGEPTL